MFEFQIITSADGTQIIDRRVKTPYEALTPSQMLEYSQVSNSMFFIDRMNKRREKKRFIDTLRKLFT